MPFGERKSHDSLAYLQGGEGGLPQAGSKPGGYVPPSKRGGGGGEGDSMRRREENSVRVTNLSEDTREDDLRVGALTLQSLNIYAGACMAKRFVCLHNNQSNVRFDAPALLIATLSHEQTLLWKGWAPSTLFR